MADNMISSLVTEVCIFSFNLSPSARKSTPVIHCHGDSDMMVNSNTAVATLNHLQQAGLDDVTLMMSSFFPTPYLGSVNPQISWHATFGLRRRDPTHRCVVETQS